MLKINIRKARKEDLDSVYRMVCELEEEELNRDEFENIFKNNLDSKDVYYVVAEVKKKVVGFISLHVQKILHHTGAVAEVQELFVEFDLRGQGVGKKLVKYVEKIAQERGCKLFEVACRLKSESAHKFYQREGFLKSHYKFTSKIN